MSVERNGHCEVLDVLCDGSALRRWCYICERKACRRCSTVVTNMGLRIRVCLICLTDPDASAAHKAAAVELLR